MLNEFIKEAIVVVAGANAEPIANLLNSDKYINEFLIAKKLNLTINQTRNILYKISDAGLVSSIKKKDKKKGWFTYFWRIEPLKVLDFLKQILLRRIEQIKNQISNRESKQYYICERCNIEMVEDNAILVNFTCSECGDVFKLKDNSKLISEFKKNLSKLEFKLSLINQEIEKEHFKINKSKSKEAKRTVKEKLEKRKSSIKKSNKKKYVKAKKPLKSFSKKISKKIKSKKRV